MSLQKEEFTNKPIQFCKNNSTEATGNIELTHIVPDKNENFKNSSNNKLEASGNSIEIKLGWTSRLFLLRGNVYSKNVLT